ncbi:hypothetical protein [Wohlfahrtiimonas chitiniclastica]|uniref:hypothetical protein n=1 Tax=Wohlfahrtiimonas chitiniclastica TaxID=400946 RepID=UPI0012DEAD4E|nr:hypothetical protein [Wohlfahrtiimonas chitiniclastica]
MMKKEKYCSVLMTTLMIGIPLGAVLILIVYAFGFMTVPEGKSTYDFIVDHGSLMAGFMALIAAIIAFYSQKQSTHKQIDAQRYLALESLRISKIEELYSVVEGLRIKIILTRSDKVKDPVTDIDVFIHDLSKVIMLCQLHSIVDDDLLNKYKNSVHALLSVWKTCADQMLNGEKLSEEDADEFQKNSLLFLENTDQFLSHLSSLSRSNG